LLGIMNMYFVVLEINDEFTGSAGQDFFQAPRLPAFDQPEIVDKFIERWTGLIGNV